MHILAYYISPPISFLNSLMFYHTYIQEESTEWARRTVDVASATEDTAAINEMHNQVLAKTLFAVDAPDGEHDLEDVVSRDVFLIIILTQVAILQLRFLL